MKFAFEWHWPSGATNFFEGFFRDLRCAECGELHSREEWHYRDGDFELTITVDTCPRVSAR